MLPVLVFWHFIISIALVGLVLMHSGRDTGMSGMGFVPQSQGGTHIVERNLTRLTIVVATIFFTNTIILFRFLD
jgi:preprotein translocase subunit SecG